MPDDAVRLRRTHTPGEVAAVAGLPIGEVERLMATGRLRAIRLAAVPPGGLGLDGDIRD